MRYMIRFCPILCNHGNAMTIDLETLSEVECRRLRRALTARLHRHNLCQRCGQKLAATDHYMVTRQVWREEAGLPARNCLMHVHCLQAHLGRALTVADFTDVPVNANILFGYGLAR